VEAWKNLSTAFLTRPCWSQRPQLLVMATSKDAGQLVGRSLSYTAKIQVQRKICWWARPYTASYLKPGDEIRGIKLG